MQRVLGNLLCNLGQGQIMYFLENAYSPYPLDVATSNFAGAYVTGCRGYSLGQHLVCDLDRKIKVKVKVADICHDVPSTAAL